jgi:hypothetical protein
LQKNKQTDKTFNIQLLRPQFLSYHLSAVQQGSITLFSPINAPKGLFLICYYISRCFRQGWLRGVLRKAKLRERSLDTGGGNEQYRRQDREELSLGHGGHEDKLKETAMI